MYGVGAAASPPPDTAKLSGTANPLAAALPSSGPIELVTAAQLRERLKALQGRIVIVNLWATWCVPCLREIPALLEVTTDLKERGVVLVGLAMDDPADFERVERFRQQYFPAFRSWQSSESDMDIAASVVDEAWNEVLPTTYLIDRQGKMVTRLQGARSYEEFRRAVEVVDR